MDKIIEFFTNYYLVFIIISVILIFALIGYIVDNKSTDIRIKPKKEKQENQKSQTQPINLSNNSQK